MLRSHRPISAFKKARGIRGVRAVLALVLVSSSHADAPSAPQPRLSSGARPSLFRSRPGSRLRGRRVRDEGASGGRA
ncbi:hypothetical protein ABZW96_37115, partial [Nocardia sp. NPDC004168]|uniref:hypothetical protein n=1 Tax=Nocardia sp. NPDC004168 TaxID=3154452 RepID=UPI0033AB3C9B